MEITGKNPRRRHSFTAEFKTEIVGLRPARGPVCRPGREWPRPDRDSGAGVGQAAERDAGTRQDGGLTSDEGRAAAGEQAAARRRGSQAGYGFFALRRPR